MKDAISFLSLLPHLLLVVTCMPQTTNSTYPSLRRQEEKTIRNGFIIFRKTACNKENPSEYEVKETENCQPMCARKTWCMGYENTWSEPRKCLLFRSTPTPGEPQNGVSCAQVNWRSPAPSATPSPKWTFIVLADIHTFTAFAYKDLWGNKGQTTIWRTISRILTHVKEQYGGDLVMMPGDQVSFGPVKTQKIIDKTGGNLPAEEAVYKAGFNSHKAARLIFEEAGYHTILSTIGDHDIGGNEGFVPLSHEDSKIGTIPSYRRSFGDGFNRNEQKQFLFDKPLGDVPSRPLGTPYEDTSFAYVHKNALFVTVDAFQIIGDGTEDYVNREKGIGGEGAVTCTVSGDHLTWFERVLQHGKNSDTIKHIFVQAHLPIIQPVQRIDCSGQFFDLSEQSDFWQLMNKYEVDIYFAGEVHANTATKSTTNGSNLVQIVSRGVRLGNVISVDVFDDVIDIKIFNEYGNKKFFNGQYEQSGHLTIDKSSQETKMSSSGSLKLLDLESEILSFDFEETLPLGQRPVLGLFGDDSIMATDVKIRDKICRHSMSNKGEFGAQYDAQVTNISLTKGRNERGYAGLFNEDSRFAIYGSGPYSGGEIISFGLWIMTTHSAKMVLVHHANYWGSYVTNLHPVYDHFTLSLENGNVVINTQPDIQWRSQSAQNLADGQWHHIAVSMPRKSSLVSELDVYVDGIRTTSYWVDGDRPIFETIAGRMSLGGFGYSNSGFEHAYPGMGPYTGAMDDFRLFARPLNMRKDFPSLVKFKGIPNTSCKKSNLEEGQYVVTANHKRCSQKCRKRAWCLGFEMRLQPSYQCILFKVLPIPEESQSGVTCNQVAS